MTLEIAALRDTMHSYITVIWALFVAIVLLAVVVTVGIIFLFAHLMGNVLFMQ